MTTRASGDMTGKTVVVTGANSGIGFETSLALAKLGAQVVMISRDRTRGEVARRAVAAVSSAPPMLVITDLLSGADIRKLSQELHARLDHIDVLVNNAGGVFSTRELSGDGVEKTFATNHVAPFLLTNLVLDLLEQAPRARVVTVASEAHAGKLDMDNLQGERKYGWLSAYSASKTANILFTNELARRLSGTSVTATAVSPGPSRTRFGDEMTGAAGLFPKIMKKMPFFHSAAAGAKVVVYASSSPEVQGATGLFYMKSKERKSKKVTHDPTLATQLWDISTQLCHLETAR